MKIKSYFSIVLCLLFAFVNTNCGEGKSPSSGEISSPSIAFRLPDTGQTQDYTIEFGEDSDYSMNPPSYTPDNDDTITDNNTGQTWYIQRKEGTWDEAGQYCNTLKIGGYTDWRLPSAKELAYLADYGTSSFSSFYWSSTPNAFNGDYAWVVSLPRGFSATNRKPDVHNVRCVRGDTFAGENVVHNGDKTVTDYTTGLMWQHGHIAEDVFEWALRYCEHLTLAGYDNWRLPNIKELTSIVDYTRYWPAIDPTYFSGTHSMTYWSSTTDTSSPADIFHVDFDIGCIKTRFKESQGSKYVRCVRNIQ